MASEHSMRKLSKKALEKKQIKEEYFTELTRKLEAVKTKIDQEKVAFVAEREKVLEEINEIVAQNIVTKDEVEQLYEEYLNERRKKKSKQQPVYAAWKRLNDFIIKDKDKERKEREKWVF